MGPLVTLRPMKHKTTSENRNRKAEHFSAKYGGFAEQFADLVLHPDYDWLRRYFLAGGFTHPVGSARELAIDILRADGEGVLIPKETLDMVRNRDREKLIAFVRANLEQAKPNPDELFRHLQILHPTVLRREIKKMEGAFALHRGPIPKMPRHKHLELLELSDRLVLVLEKLLRELQSGTKRPISDFLLFWKQEHPKACSFLLKRLPLLHLALGDKGLQKRGIKIETRARVLADALAGSEYWTLRTSYDRTTTARRAKSKK
jgi:hypothetical protein